MESVFIFLFSKIFRNHATLKKENFEGKRKGGGGNRLTLAWMLQCSLKFCSFASLFSMSFVVTTNFTRLPLLWKSGFTTLFSFSSSCSLSLLEFVFHLISKSAHASRVFFAPLFNQPTNDEKRRVVTITAPLRVAAHLTVVSRRRSPPPPHKLS